MSHYRFYEKVIKVKDDVAAILKFSFLGPSRSGRLKPSARLFFSPHRFWNTPSACERGMHKGAAALLWGEPAASMRASAFCWRAACFRRGGIPSRPGLPLGGNGKGGSNSLLPQAILVGENAHFSFLSCVDSFEDQLPGNLLPANTLCHASIRTLCEPPWARCMLRSDSIPGPSPS
jgi:hypothetical protein